MGGLVDVVAAWFTGRPTDNLQLLGLTMIFWGRLGKSMLYLAGLSILLDLADPGKLRQRGAASTVRAGRTFQRMRRTRHVARVVRMYQSVRDDIVRTVPRRGVVLITWPPTDVPAGIRLPLSEYRDFREDVLAALPGEHSCRDEHEIFLCPQQVRYVARRVDDLVAEHLPADQRDLMREAEASRSSNAPLVAILAIPAIVAGVVRFGDPVREVTSLSLGIALALLTFLVVALPDVRLSIAAVGYRLWGVVLSAYGRLLDQTRPLHLFRWVAAGLFLIGGPLDLLAS